MWSLNGAPIGALPAIAFAAMVGGCATTPMIDRPAAPVVAELAPTGKLRAAINFGNPVLAQKDPASGEPRGVSVDLSRELARRLSVPIDFVIYTAAGKVVEDATTGIWDVAFVAIDPARAVDMDYTAAYVVIEGAYVVQQDSAIRSNAEVDRDGVRVVAAQGSAYDLYLARELKHAKIVHVATSQAVVSATVAGVGDVGAGVKQQLESSVKEAQGARMLDGRFMEINQAMATPKGRAAGARYLAAFVEEMKASGFVAAALTRSGVEGAALAPPAGKAR